jgi:uncharacterized protein (DUF342 family)
MNEGDSKSGNMEENEPRIIIEISEDKLTAFVSVILPEDGGQVKSEAVMTALKEKGVVYGIDNNALQEINGSKNEISKSLIAAGIKPNDGKAGKINCLIDTDKSTKVIKGEKIAEIEKPAEGEDGTNVLGENIPFNSEKEINKPVLENVEIHEEDNNIFCSNTNGYLQFKTDKIMVRPIFELEISDNVLEAWLTVHKPIKDNDWTKEDLFEFLKNNEITFGIQNDIIDNIFKDKIFDEKILIARGQKVEDGKNGWLKYYFDTHVGPKEDEKGNVNHKELNLIQNVQNGDKLAEIMPPAIGVNGITVTNQSIPAKPGADVSKPALTNASYDSGNPNLIIALENGHVISKGNAIIVDPVFYVKEDVDYSTGNIDCDGSVFVNGNVISGFSVKSNHDVEINGFVEDAVIEAGGNVLLKSGFTGRGHGRIEAKGKVIAQFCENQLIISEEDICFCEYIMRCKIVTAGRLLVTEQKGLIVGGEIFAQNGVEAKTIGNQSYTPTEIVVGVNREAQKSLNEKQSELKELNNKLKMLAKAIGLIKTKKLINRKLTLDKQILFKKLINADSLLTEKAKTIQSDVDTIKSDCAEYIGATVKVNETIFPKTKITIFDKHLEVIEEASHIVFKYSDEGIKIEPWN